MQASCCHDPQNALVEEGWLSPGQQARCCWIHRMLWQEGVLSHAVMQAAVMIHRMLWWKKGVLSLRHMQAAAVVTECSGGGTSLRCHASSLLL
jgi:hypothetical protein